jgi:hypothetical protein
VPRRIFGPKRSGRLRLHNEKLCNLYTSPNVIRVAKSSRMRWVEHVACKEQVRNAYKILVGKPEGKGPLGRPKCRWEDNIRMTLRDIRWEGMGCINLA